MSSIIDEVRPAEARSPELDRSPAAGPAGWEIVGAALRCAGRVAGMFVRGQLHRHRDRVGSTFRIPDGREFRVFRETSSHRPAPETPVTLAVWFRLRGISGPGSSVRRFLFERESILNTLLFAGFDGYLVKLWMVSPVRGDYAGLYSWADREAALDYARYITAVLRPLSVTGSVGFEIVDEPDLSTFAVDAGRRSDGAWIEEQLVVDADPMTTWQAAHDLDFLSVHTPLLDLAFWARGLPARLRRVPQPAVPPQLLLCDEDGLGLPGWVLLGVEPGRALTFGGIGKVWQGAIEWRDVAPEDFAAFDEPGFAKMECAFTTRPCEDGWTLLSYHCRTTTTDEASGRKFHRYWVVIKPFVGHIMRATLREIATAAERPVGARD